MLILQLTPSPIKTNIKCFSWIVLEPSPDVDGDFSVETPEPLLPESFSDSVPLVGLVPKCVRFVIDVCARLRTCDWNALYPLFL